MLLQLALMNFSFRPKPLITLLSTRYYSSATVSDQAHILLRCLNLSTTRQSPQLTRQCHARILVLGLRQNPFLATKLVSAYATLPNLTDSRLVFDSVEVKSVFLWNTLINCYVKSFEFSKAIEVFREMCIVNAVIPDDFTLATMAKALGEKGYLAVGESVHGKSVRVGFGSDVVVSNSLVSMYFRCGKFGCARKLFDDMPIRNAGSWNAVIAGYLGCRDRSLDREVWEFLKLMQVDGIKLDGFTVSSVLPLCGGVKWPDFGREIHCYVVKNGFKGDLGFDVRFGCCLIDMYSKSCRVVEGRKVFDRMKSRNVYAWTAIINGYADNGDSYEALSLFRNMQVKDGIEPNRVSLVSVLPACNLNASLIGVKQIHGFTIRKVLNHDVSLCNALIDMYAKCGSLDLARRVFENEAFCKDAISWSSMISGYGLHGQGEEAVSLYDEMVGRGIRPDVITIVGLLSACGRSGLVDKGLEIYGSVVSKFEIEPTDEMCACVVDMLGRSARLEQALEFIKRMLVKPGPSVWGSLVNTSIMHGDSKMQELAYQFLVELQPENASNFISLSNLYASSEQWDSVAEVRMAMKERGLRKEPGCSWISINSTTHCFYVADKSHSCSNSIYEMLHKLKFTMKGLSNPSFDFEIPT